MRRVRRLVFGALAVTVYRRLILYERDLAVRVPIDPDTPSASLGVLATSDLEHYARLRPDAPPGDAARRLARGERCFVARRDGDLVAMRWLSTERADIEYLGLSFPLGPGLTYAYDGFTDPEARGSGFATLSGAHMGDQLRREGYRAVLSTMLPENELARYHLLRLGARPVGTVGCLRLGPLRLPLRRLPEGYLGAASRL
jgi:GNAT superfamily N-acetyltransferase